MPQQAITDAEVQSCFPVMQELRPHLIKDAFLNTIRHMETEGFRLAYIKDDNEVVAAAGFRIYTNLVVGKHLYVDDLITAEKHRSKGYGEQMITWLRNLAKEQGCRYFHLDSGTHRDQAHKFYFRQGLVIKSYHFAEVLESGA